jgi:TatD DNase family protein
LTLNVIDTHAHLDMPEFDQDREAVITRALDAGVTMINTIGVDVASSRKAIELAEKYPGVFATVGIHPQEAEKASKEDIAQLAELARHPRVVAVGEMGLDFYRENSSHESQLRVLQWELDLAKTVGLPVVIHSRQAQETILPILQNWAGSYSLPEGKPRGVLHSFNRDSDIEIARKYLEMGFFISVGAYIGYPSSAQLRETLKDIPLDRLVVETDCPYLPPQKLRGKRNEPSYVLFTLGVLAEVKNMTPEEMAVITTQNAKRLFNLSGKP